MVMTEMKYYEFTCVGCGRQYCSRDKGMADRQVCADCEEKRGAEKESKADRRARSREPVDGFKLAEDEKDGK